MRQKCIKMGLVLLGKEERPKCVRIPSKLGQKCVKNPRNTFRGEHLLDDTDILGVFEVFFEHFLRNLGSGPGG